MYFIDKTFIIIGSLDYVAAFFETITDSLVGFFTTTKIAVVAIGSPNFVSCFS